MNCEKCQGLLSDFLDGALGHAEHASVSAHLAACRACSAARDDFHSIIGAARDARQYLYAPSDESALWTRVRSAVEAERKVARAEAAYAAPRAGFFGRLMQKRWEFSLPQLAGGVAALAAVFSLVTFVGVRFASPDSGAGTRGVRRVVSEDYYPRTYVEPHEASLRFWQQRVEARKASWSPRMRASFERSIYVLDQTVNESLSDLRQNPHDEVAEEMLNSALRDKIELMREFGEQ